MIARLALFCALWASCVELPDIPIGVCGNHILEPGEDCDESAAGCVQPGRDGECHRECVITSDCPVGSICQGEVCRSAPNICGNRHADAYEDCDGTPGCGPPDGGVAACRFVCSPGVACPMGSRCGRDTVCRWPLGGFVPAPHVGTADAHYQLEDVDRDGYLDVVERQRSRLTVFHNDRQGGFTMMASGTVRGSPGTVLAGAAIAPPQPPGSTEARAIALISPSGIDLLQLRDNGAIDPQVVGAAFIPDRPDDASMLGVIVDTPNGLPRPLFVNTVSGTLSSFDVPSSYTSGGSIQPRLQGSLNASPCNLSFSLPIFAAISTPPGEVSAVVVGSQANNRLCLVAPDAAAGKLTVSALDLAGFSLGETAPVFADVDGDGKRDLIAASSFATGDLLLYLRRTATGFAAPVALPVAPTQPFFFGSDQLSAVDLDGDGRDDLISGAEVLLNRTATTGGFEWAQPSPFAPLSGSNSVAGDLNRDRAGDVALYQPDLQPSQALKVCQGDGGGQRFGCDTVVLPTVIEAAHLGDLNGDLTNDLIAVGPGEIDVLLGRPFQPISPTALVTRIDGGKLHVALRALPNRTASDLLVEYSNGDSHQLAVGASDSIGRIQFALVDDNPLDVRFSDLDGDARSDLVALSFQSSGFASVQFTTARGGGLADFAEKRLIPNVPLPTLDPQLALVGDDPRPAFVGRSRGGIVVSHLRDGAYQTFIAPMPDLPDAHLYVVDLEGDGRNELVVIGQEKPRKGCSVAVGRFAPGADAPTITVTPLGDDCISPLLVDITDRYGGNPDGRVDLVTWSQTSTNGLPLLFVLGADDRFVQQDPTASQLVWSAVSTFGPDTWLATADLNGDGLLDLVTQTSDGLNIYLARVLGR